MGAKRLDVFALPLTRLTPIVPGEPIRAPCGLVQTTWVCRCDCGKSVTVRTTTLSQFPNRGCGCGRQKLWWTKEELLKLGAYSDTELAREWGVSPLTIKRKRDSLGIPARGRVQRPVPIASLSPAELRAAHSQILGNLAPEELRKLGDESVLHSFALNSIKFVEKKRNGKWKRSKRLN